MNFDYIYDFQKERYQLVSKRDLTLKSDSEIDIVFVKNGIIMPLEKKNGYLFGSGGVFYNNGNYVKESATISRGGTVHYPGEDIEIYVGEPDCCREPITSIDERVCFLGYLNNHWGHFIIDFCSRLWYALENKGCKYAFIVNENDNFELISQIKEFLLYLNINEQNLYFINRPTLFKEVVIPKQSYVSNYYYSNKYLSIFDFVVKKAIKNHGDLNSNIHKKIYFCRDRYRKANQTEFGEDMLIDLFKKNGFSIISPETYTLCEQIALYRNADIIAGIAGTIPHNMMFAKQGQKLWIINKTYIINMMQMDINVMKELDVEYVDAYASYSPCSLGQGPFLLSISPELVCFCNDNKLSLPSKKYRSDYYIKKLVKNYVGLSGILNYKNSSNQIERVDYFNPSLTNTFALRFSKYLGSNTFHLKIVLFFRKIKIRIIELFNI